MSEFREAMLYAGTGFALAGTIGFVGVRAVDGNFIKLQPFQDKSKAGKCTDYLAQAATNEVSEVPNACRPFKTSFAYKEQIVNVYMPDKDAAIKSVHTDRDNPGQVITNTTSKIFTLPPPREFASSMNRQRSKQPYTGNDAGAEAFGAMFAGFVGFGFGLKYAIEKQLKRRREPELQKPVDSGPGAACSF